MKRVFYYLTFLSSYPVVRCRESFCPQNSVQLICNRRFYLCRLYLLQQVVWFDINAAQKYLFALNGATKSISCSESITSDSDIDALFSKLLSPSQGLPIIDRIYTIVIYGIRDSLLRPQLTIGFHIRQFYQHWYLIFLTTASCESIKSNRFSTQKMDS